MNILEAFHFIFEADASNLESGLKRADRLNTDFQDHISDTDDKAKMLGSAFLDLTKKAVGLFAGLATISGIKTMSAQIADQVAALDTQATALNVNAGELYTWQNAVIAAGGTADGFNSTLANLNKVTRDPERTLLRLSDSFKKLSSYRAQKLGAMMGIDAGTAELLRSGREGVQALLDKEREMGVITAEQIEVSKKYRDSLRDTERVYDDIRRRIAIAVLPIMTQWLDLIRGTVRFLQEHKPFAIAFFAGVAGIITAMYLPAMLRAIAATYALLAPYLLIGAAVAAVAGIFALAVDDVYNFLEGNDSLIGRLAEKWPWIGDMIRGVAADFKALWELAKELGQILVLLFTDPEQAWERFKSLLVKGLADLMAQFPGVTAVALKIQDAFNVAGGAIMKTFGAIGDAIKAVFQGFVDGWNKLLSYLPESVQKKLGIEVSTVVNEETGPGEQEAKGQAVQDVVQNAVNRAGSSIYDPNGGTQPAQQPASAQNPEPAQQPAPNAGGNVQTPAAAQGGRKMAPTQPSVTNNDNRTTNNDNRTTNTAAAASTAPPLPVPERKSQQPRYEVKIREPEPKPQLPEYVAPAANGKYQTMMATAQQGVQEMSNNRINNLSSNVLNQSSKASTRTTEVNIDNIEVNTQATDAEGIAQAIDGGLRAQFQDTTAQHEDCYVA